MSTNVSIDPGMRMLAGGNAAVAEQLSSACVKALLPRVVSNRPGAMVQTLSIGVATAIAAETFRERAERITGLIRSHFARAPWSALPVSVFRERIPYPATSARAEELCRREADRPATSATQHQLRIAYFEFADGSARIIARSHRALVGRQLLFSIAMHMACGAEISLQAASDEDAVRLEPAALAELTPVPPWTSSAEERGTSQVKPLWIRGTRLHLLPALSRVLGAFTQRHGACLPLLTDQAEQECPAAAGSGGWQLVALDDDLQASSAQLLEPRARASAWLNDQCVALLTEHWGMEHTFVVGLAVAEALPPQNGAIRDVSYQPFLAPPFPITILCEERADGYLALGIHYDHAALDRHGAKWLQLCIANVVAAMTAANEVPLADIALLTALQREATLLLGCGRGPERLLSNHRLEQQVSALASLSPDAVAVSDGHRLLSYGELERRTNQLARELMARGVSRGERVGLCLSRSAHMLMAALAVLKAGGVYVPIDPDYPADRIAYVCEDAGLKVYVFDTLEAGSSPAASSITLADWMQRAQVLPDGALADATLAIDDPAYMIYTSGSTGRPKGVLVSHRNVQALLGAVRAQFELHAGDVWSLFHSFAFDFSVWEAWGALLTGARLHVVPFEISRQPDDFIDLVNRERITILSQTPSAFGQLMAHESRRPIGSHLRLVIFGGEALDTRSLLGWFDRHPEQECRLINMFGITETTVHVTATEIRRIHALAGSRSVGRPIDGWGVYVLAPDQSVLPLGVDGEIYVRGSGVALGYHNRPELNQQRFLPDLLGSGRMYRSGDRGRLLANGELLHLGRLDNQVKLRGFRIELDEIRNVLLRCRGVQTAAALFSQRDHADPATARIDAYVVMNSGSLAEVWSQVLQLLPEYMLPTSIARVSAMPLTGNGKLHAKKLADSMLESRGRPTRAVPEVQSVGVSAANSSSIDSIDSKRSGRPDIQHHLIQIWTELFAKPVAADDNFFDLGGNSLFAVRMSSRLRQRGLPSLHPRDLYTHQTIARLSAVLVADADGA